MKLGFFNVWRGHPEHVVMADLLIRSARHVMPDVPIIHLTDADTPAIVGVDDVRRLPKMPFDVLRCEHLAHCEGDWLYLDTDCVLQQDIRHIFEMPFDVAVADRDGCLVEGEEDLPFIQATPYNLGVVFSRSRDFWMAVKDKLLTMTSARQEWMGIQFAACDVVAEGRFDVRILPGRLYNYAPHHADEDLRHAAIVHYKGPMRKDWMMQRFMEASMREAV